LTCAIAFSRLATFSRRAISSSSFSCRSHGGTDCGRKIRTRSSSGPLICGQEVAEKPQAPARLRSLGLIAAAWGKLGSLRQRGDNRGLGTKFLFFPIRVSDRCYGLDHAAWSARRSAPRHSHRLPSASLLKNQIVPQPVQFSQVGVDAALVDFLRHLAQLALSVGPRGEAHEDARVQGGHTPAHSGRRRGRAPL